MGIEATPLADPDENVIPRVWDSVPVFELEQLLDQSRRRKADLNAAFRKFKFQVNHPEAQLRPRERRPFYRPKDSPCDNWAN
jgi:hypothetical protein